MKTGSTTITPRLGQIVRYTLTADDARVIRQQRIDAGGAARKGNDAHEGDTYPAMIVRDWMTSDPELLAKYRDGEIHDGSGRVITLEEMIANASVNLQVFLDGNDTHWVTSRSLFLPDKHGHRVQVIDGIDREVGSVTDEDWDIQFRPDPRGHWDDTPVAW